MMNAGDKFIVSFVKYSIEKSCYKVVIIIMRYKCYEDTIMLQSYSHTVILVYSHDDYALLAYIIIQLLSWHIYI